MMAMSLCVGCSSKKEDSKETTTATTEAKMKVQSKYKVPKITAAKKTDQLAEAQKGETIVTMQVKGYGEMKFKFFMKKAPLAVKNFVTLASNGYFDGQIFHRVINDFMIQGGDPSGNGTGGPGYSIKGEFSGNDFAENTLAHTAGVISMARAMDPDSAGSQFFIMHKNAPHLDGQYAAFGKITEGMDIVDKIATCETDWSDAPMTPVVMKTVTVDTFGDTYPEPEKC